MRDKKMWILLGVLVIFLMVFFFYDDQNKPSTISFENQVDFKNLQAIALEKEESSLLTLEHGMGTWTYRYKDQPVKAMKIYVLNKIVEDLQAMTSLEFITNKKDSLKKYGLDEAQRVKVEIKDKAGKTLVFSLGEKKEAESSSRDYLEYQGKIYVVLKPIQEDFGVKKLLSGEGVDDVYLRNQISALDYSNVTSLEIVDEGEKIPTIFNRKDQQWEDKEGKTTRSEQVEELIRAAITTTVKSIKTTSKEEDLKTATLARTIKLAGDGQIETIQIAKEGGDTVSVYVSTRPNGVLISRGDAEKLLTVIGSKSSADNPPAGDTAKVNEKVKVDEKVEKK